MSSIERNRRHLQESEGERRFREHWERLVPDLVLHQEYECGPYRLDFAHVPTRTAIEIDGLLGHASARDIEKDRQRQRALEDLGWRFRRFGGREAMYATPSCVRDAAAFIRRVRPAPSQEDPFSQERPSFRERIPSHPFFWSQAASARSDAALPLLKRSASGSAPSASGVPSRTTTTRRLSRRRLLAAGALALGGSCLCESTLLPFLIKTGLVGRPPALAALASAPLRSGEVLYQADWHHGLAGWQMEGQWQLHGEMLLSPDAHPASLLAVIWAPVVVIAPAYAIQAQLRYLTPGPGAEQSMSLGLMVAGLSQVTGLAAVLSCSSTGEATARLGPLSGRRSLPLSDDPSWLSGASLRLVPPLDTHAHLYRLEVRGKRCIMLIDGQTILQGQEKLGAASQRGGIIAQGGQVAVSAFQILAL
jgi:very-short-patch-repair endonuclease